MSIFNDRYDGEGVPKNAPPQKEPFRFFELFRRKFTKLIELNLLYILTVIPAPLTFGAANAALAHVMRKFVLEESVFVAHEYFTAFKKNFKRCLLVGFIDFVLTLALTFEAVCALAGEIQMLPAFAFAVFYHMARFYLYVMLAALNQSVTSVVKNALTLAILGLKRNLLMLAVNFAVFAAFILAMPYTVLLFPFMPYAQCVFFTVYTAYPLVQKHIINPYYESIGETNPEL